MNNQSCNFCHASKGKVKTLVVGGDGAICDDCITRCNDIITQGGETAVDPEAPEEEVSLVEERSFPTPRQIKEHLDEYVIGHTTAKEVLSVAVYNHYKRITNEDDTSELDKSNILMMGPTGTGKTLLAKTIAKLLDVPFAIADASSLTEAGYVGDDVESILTRLLISADGDVGRAEMGIVYIDEIDKKRSRSSSFGQKDVSGEGVQQALLKLIEGGEVFVPPTGSKKNNSQQTIRIDTSNILFIVGGAFVGLEELIERERTQGKIGFSQEPRKESSTEITTEHLIKYGMIPELIGRLPVRAQLDKLDETHLVHILTEPKNSITKQFSQLFEMDDISLEFEPDALLAIAKSAIEQKTGARGLRTIVERVLQDTQFILPELSNDGIAGVRVHEGAITNKEKPLMIMKETSV